MDVGKKILNLRLQNNIKQNDLANIIGVSKSTMSNYERNYSTPDFDTLIRIADYFDISIDFLLDHKSSNNLQVNSLTNDKDSNTFSKDEKNVINYYQRLNDENKDYIKGKMISLYHDQNGNENSVTSPPATG